MQGKIRLSQSSSWGDSHIQAGHLSGRVMRLFPTGVSGNAGRGWIAPFKLSKTNEPDDYFIKSVAKDWNCRTLYSACPENPDRDRWDRD